MANDYRAPGKPLRPSFYADGRAKCKACLLAFKPSESKLFCPECLDGVRVAAYESHETTTLRARIAMVRDAAFSACRMGVPLETWQIRERFHLPPRATVAALMKSLGFRPEGDLTDKEFCSWVPRG